MARNQTLRPNIQYYILQVTSCIRECRIKAVMQITAVLASPATTSNTRFRRFSKHDHYQEDTWLEDIPALTVKSSMRHPRSIAFNHVPLLHSTTSQSVCSQRHQAVQPRYTSRRRMNEDATRPQIANTETSNVTKNKGPAIRSTSGGIKRVHFEEPPCARAVSYQSIYSIDNEMDDERFQSKQVDQTCYLPDMRESPGTRAAPVHTESSKALIRKPVASTTHIVEDGSVPMEGDKLTAIHDPIEYTVPVLDDGCHHTECVTPIQASDLETENASHHAPHPQSRSDFNPSLMTPSSFIDILPFLTSSLNHLSSLLPSFERLDNPDSIRELHVSTAWIIKMLVALYIVSSLWTVVAAVRDVLLTSVWPIITTFGMVAWVLGLL